MNGYLINHRMAAGGFAHPIVVRLADLLTARSITCREILHSA
jgi:hypothetical protein